MRPIIGITCYAEPARWGVWDARAVLLPETYVQAVARAGGQPVVLPPVHDGGVLRALDGLVLAGGADVSPSLYGAVAHELTVPRPDRDISETALLTAAAGMDLPVLGVCRGMQLMAVHAGGSLHQHLPDLLGHDKHRPAPGLVGAHGARFVPGSRVAAVLGEECEVNSYHHQGVADPGTLTVTGWSDDDLIEVVEDPARRFYLGVQWHPEETGDIRLFAALVSACTGRG